MFLLCTLLLYLTITEFCVYKHSISSFSSLFILQNLYRTSYNVLQNYKTVFHGLHKMYSSRRNFILTIEIRYHNANALQRRIRIRPWIPMCIITYTYYKNFGETKSYMKQKMYDLIKSLTEKNAMHAKLPLLGELAHSGQKPKGVTLFRTELQDRERACSIRCARPPSLSWPRHSAPYLSWLKCSAQKVS